MERHHGTSVVLEHSDPRYPAKLAVHTVCVYSDSWVMARCQRHGGAPGLAPARPSPDKKEARVPWAPWAGAPVRDPFAITNLKPGRCCRNKHTPYCDGSLGQLEEGHTTMCTTSHFSKKSAPFFVGFMPRERLGMPPLARSLSVVSVVSLGLRCQVKEECKRRIPSCIANLQR